MSLSLGACVARFKLAEVDIEDARLDPDGTASLYVYPSNRTIILYDRNDAALRRVGREIDRDRMRDRLRVLWTRHTSGAIVDEDLSNGARRLWVTFDIGKCTSRECGFGFVQTEDGKFQLQDVPEREYYNPPMVHRDCTLEKRRMKIGNLKALSEANQVYRLKKRKKTRTVFLEVKINTRERKRTRTERLRGRDGR